MQTRAYVDVGAGVGVDVGAGVEVVGVRVGAGVGVELGAGVGVEVGAGVGVEVGAGVGVEVGVEVGAAGPQEWASTSAPASGCTKVPLSVKSISAVTLSPIPFHGVKPLGMRVRTRPTDRGVCTSV
jgi:hypothetical protein